MLSATMFVCIETPQTLAQDAPPNLRMLLNLDLFESRQNDASARPAPGNAASDDSMLDQIRTLDSMGYLGRSPSADASDDAPRGSDDAPRASDYGSRESGDEPRSPAAPPNTTVIAPAPPINPDYDAEGPQR